MKPVLWNLAPVVEAAEVVAIAEETAAETTVVDTVVETTEIGNSLESYQKQSATFGSRFVLYAIHITRVIFSLCAGCRS
jgi:hypothetical protein